MDKAIHLLICASDFQQRVRMLLKGEDLSTPTGRKTLWRERFPHQAFTGSPS